MPNTKLSRSNKKIKPQKIVAAPDTTEEMGEPPILPSSKIKKVSDVDLHDDIVGAIEEKPEVDPLLSEEETDELAADEAGLDDEEINPFGDKWEV